MAKVQMDGIYFADTLEEKVQFTTPFLSFDRALKHPLVGGSIVQTIGEKSTGKTTLALHLIAHNQAHCNLIDVTVGKTTRQINAVFVDLERSFDPVYAQSLGVDMSKLLIFKPLYAELGFLYIEKLLSEGLQLVVWDSVPAAITKDEFDKTMEDSPQMAGSANKLSRWLPRLLTLTDSADALFIFINQYRANMSPMARSNKKPFGARALEYYSKVIIELTRIKNERDAGTSEVELLVSKNKNAAEGGRTVLTLEHGSGFNRALDIIRLGVETEVIRKSGAWYYYGDHKAQGEQNALLFPIDQIEQDVRNILIQTNI